VRYGEWQKKLARAGLCASFWRYAFECAGRRHPPDRPPRGHCLGALRRTGLGTGCRSRICCWPRTLRATVGGSSAQPYAAIEADGDVVATILRSGGLAPGSFWSGGHGFWRRGARLLMRLPFRPGLFARWLQEQLWPNLSVEAGDIAGNQRLLRRFSAIRKRPRDCVSGRLR